MRAVAENNHNFPLFFLPEPMQCDVKYKNSVLYFTSQCMLYKYNKIFIQKSHNTYLDRDYCKFILVHGLHHEVKALNHLRINQALVFTKDTILVPVDDGPPHIRQRERQEWDSRRSSFRSSASPEQFGSELVKNAV